MRVLILVPSYVPAYVYGGPIFSVAALCEAMVRLGHGVSVMTTTANGKSELPEAVEPPEIIQGVEVHRYRRMTGDHSNFTPHLLLDLWQSVKQYDIVHIQSWWNLVAMPAALICLLRGVRPVISPRGSLTAYTFGHRRQGLKRTLHKLGGKLLLTRSLIHVTSDRERIDVLETVPQADIRELPNILPLPKPFLHLGNPTEGIRILFLGRIDPKKRLDFLIHLLHGFKDVPWQLSIVGDGDPQYIALLKASGGNDPRIAWFGPCYGEEKWRHYADADLVALPSHNENYGNVVIEALSQGTPVLLSGEVGIADWVTANRLGWIAGPGESDWRDAIAHVYGQSDERQRIRREGPVCVRRDFEPDMLGERYIDMYKDLIRSRS